MIILITIGILCLAALMLHLRQYQHDQKDLAAMLPILKVEKDCIVSKQGDLTLAFELTLPEVFSLSTDEFEALHHTWIRAIRVLPAGTIVHKQDWYTEEKFKPKHNDEQERSFLSIASDAHFSERQIMDHRCYVFITRKATGRKPSNAVFNNLLRPNLLTAEQVSGQAYHDFEDKVGQFQRLLSEGSFIRARKLTTAELVGTPTTVGLMEKYSFLLTEQETPALKDITFKPDFRIGDHYCQLYSLADVEHLPGLVASRITYDKYSTDKTKFSVSFAAPLGQLLGCNHIYNQFITIEDTQKTLKKFEAKRRRLQSLSAYSRENAISRDATNAFLNEAIAESRQPVRAHFHLLVWTHKQEELKELRNLASSAIAQIDANPREEIKCAPQLYWAGFPGNAADLPTHECFDTFCEQATCFLAMETAYKDSVSPTGMRLVDRQYGKPIWVDFTELPMRNAVISNRNKVIVGGSGSGKSVYTNGLVHSNVEQGAHVVVVDVGHSYQGLCNLLGGYYFTYREDAPIRFNPFYLSPGDVLDTEKKESIKTLLLALWKRDDENFRRSEYVALSNALHLYYEKLQQNPQIFPCFDTFYAFLQDDFMKVLDEQKVKEKEFDVANFLYVLRPYRSDGEFGYLLNATENLDMLSQRLIIVELDNVKDHPILFPVVTLIVAELFISKMRKLKGVKKIIIIEEAWKAIAKQGMADFIKYLYKTVRKFYGEAIVVTQEIDDVISSPIVKEAILNNSDTKILLDMRKFQNKFDQIQSVMGMPDKGKAMVLSLNKANDPNRKYREVYVELASQHMRVYGFEPSLEEYYTYTTEEKEKVMVQQYTARHGGDMRKGIKALIADLKDKSFAK